MSGGYFDDSMRGARAGGRVNLLECVGLRRLEHEPFAGTRPDRNVEWEHRASGWTADGTMGCRAERDECNRYVDLVRSEWVGLGNDDGDDVGESVAGQRLDAGRR